MAELNPLAKITTPLPTLTSANSTAPFAADLVKSDVPVLDIPTATPTVAPAASPAVVPTTAITPTGYTVKPDGSVDYQKTLTSVQESLSKIKQQADELAAKNKTTTPIVASSTDITNAENQIKTDLNAQTTSEADVTAAHNSYLDQLNNETAQLDARRAQEQAAINEQFNRAVVRQGEAQKSESGQFNATLARVGGYLGDSVSAQGAIINLNQQHLYQQQDLEAKRASALNDARVAIDDKQFALARLKAQEAKDYTKEIADNKQQFLTNKLNILSNQRQQDEANRTAIKDKLANLAYLEPSKISPQTKSEIDQFYGTPGFTDSFISVTNANAKAKSQKEIMEARKSTLDFLQSIPAGQKIKMPDGTEYTGMGKAGDVSTFLQVDSSGTGHLIAYNKLTGDKTISNVGIVGKASGGEKASPVVVDNATAIFQTSLEQAKDKQGKYDPDIYLKLRNQLKESQNASILPHIDNLFLNKNNEFFSDEAINRLRSKGVFYGSVSLPPEQTPTDSTGNDVIAGN